MDDSNLYEFLITGIEFIDPKRFTRLELTAFRAKNSEVNRHSAAHRPRALHEVNGLAVLAYDWHIALR